MISHPKIWDRSIMKETEWPFQYFKIGEFACKGSGAVFMEHDLLVKLDALRHAMNHPLYIVSGYRSEKHNKAVGGAKNSYHLKGRAVDISWRMLDARQKRRLVTEALHLGFGGFGFYSTFIHLDSGSPRVWVG